MKILGLLLSLLLTTSILAGALEIPAHSYKCVGSVHPETGETIDCDLSKDPINLFKIYNYLKTQEIRFVDSKELLIDLIHTEVSFVYKIKLKYLFKSNAILAKQIIEEEASAIYFPSGTDINYSSNVNMKRTLFIKLKDGSIVRLYDLIKERN